jgi:hypothetical protein
MDPLTQKPLQTAASHSKENDQRNRKDCCPLLDKICEYAYSTFCNSNNPAVEKAIERQLNARF